MTTTAKRLSRTMFVAITIAMTACTTPSGTIGTAPPSGVTDTDPVTADTTTETSSPTPAALSAAGGAEAATLVQELSETWVAYVGSVVVSGKPDPDAAEQLAGLYDPELVEFDGDGLGDCVVGELGSLDIAVGSGSWEHSSWRDGGGPIPGIGGSLEHLWRVTVLDNLVAGSYDGSVLGDVVVGPDGIVGHVDPVANPEDDASTADEHLSLVGCLVEAASAAPAAVASFDQSVQEIDRVHELGSNFDNRAYFSGVAGDGTVDRGGEVVQRPGLPADPADPEPIASTGSNTWDLITTADPSAFECVEYLGQGPEEFLPASKDGGYQRVPDAYLYRARFSDRTTIDIRVHPEIGTLEEADAEVNRYLIPLGQLPTVLRRDIGRFAVRQGDNTATASRGEGIMVQSGNAAVRLADNRLEETLFHESVHTSLDQLYSYQRSQEWLDAQAADGRWLTEYGRENPDSEDLAESALYGWAVLHHPDRFPAGMVDEIRGRIPNRLAFIEEIFPTNEPLIVGTGDPVACNG